MIRYYSNREVSNLLNINLARWKRWTREFLPPDPLGGLQSGYARQYSMRETFLVALGGHLVGFLKFSVHQARMILSDLDPWLEHNGYFRWNSNTIEIRSAAETNRRQYCIYIRSENQHSAEKSAFCYAVQFIPRLDLDSEESEPHSSRNEIAEFINTPPEVQKSFTVTPFLIMLNIGPFRADFLNRLYRLSKL